MLIVLVLFGTALLTAHLRQSTSSLIYTTTDTVPTNRVGIVFGARVRTNRTLTPILKDRVDGAISLYKAQKITKILMSGDNSSYDYNEVEAMKNYAIEQGIPAADIAMDHAGFSTYETCYRAKAIFGVTEATLITQKYHMYRALYTCSHLGVKSVGYALPDFERYPSLKTRYLIREYTAQVNAMWELYVTHPKPKYLGSPEAI
jgi:vancomycin permeability regulator SanA